MLRVKCLLSRDQIVEMCLLLNFFLLDEVADPHGFIVHFLWVDVVTQFTLVDCAHAEQHVKLDLVEFFIALDLGNLFDFGHE